MTWRSNRVRFHLYNQWTFHKVHWIDFNLIHLAFEFGIYKSAFEFSIGLLGFNLCVDYFYGEFQEEKFPNDFR